MQGHKSVKQINRGDTRTQRKQGKGDWQPDTLTLGAVKAVQAEKGFLCVL